MKKQITFIHCADLHLDSPFKGLSDIPSPILKNIRESTFIALTNLTNLAIQRKVDFVLMVGDVFDQEEQSMRAHIAIKKAFERLDEYDIKVYMSFGNHDYLNSQTFPRNYPDNVYVFDKEEITYFDMIKEHQPVARVYGFSYQERAVIENKASNYHKTDQNIYHIATLHGTAGNADSEEHARYAPFQLSELKQAGFDYWALGHIHKRAILSEQPAVIYPGNMQGRSMKETGEKGCYLVTLSETEQNFEFQPLHSIKFERCTIQTEQWSEKYQALEQIEASLNECISSPGKYFVELELKNVSDMVHEWIVNGSLDELIEVINQSAEAKDWIYISGYKWEMKHQRTEWMEDGGFLRELAEAFSNKNEVPEMIANLWQHPEGRKWLDKLDDKDLETYLNQAEQLLDRLLHEKEV